MEDQKNKSKEPDTAEVIFFLIREISFVLLPLIVISIVFTIKYGTSKLLYTPEWSFASTLLFGQTIIRLSSASAAAGSKIDITTGFMALLIALGLVPSLTLLTLILVLENVSFGLMTSQIILFAFAILVYFILGGAFYSLEKENNK